MKPKKKKDFEMHPTGLPVKTNKRTIKKTTVIRESIG